MNKQQLAVHLCNNGCVLTIEQIEDLLTDFLNTEKAKVRPKIDVIGQAITEPTDIDRVTDEQL
jgi:hypothetical protein